MLNGHESQGYSLFCPSAFPEKQHQKYRSESTSTGSVWYRLIIVSKHRGYTGIWCENRSRMERRQLELHLSWAEKRALKCLNKGLVLKVLVTFAVSKIPATKCDVQQGMDSFWSNLGCEAAGHWRMRKNLWCWKQFVFKIIFFWGEEEMILRSGVDVYGKLIANVIKKEKCREEVLQTEAAAL